MRKFSEIIKEENKMHVSLPKIKLLNNKYLVYLVNRFFFKTVFFKKFLKTRGLSDSQVKDFLL
jgi:hypothetical protein